MGMHTKAQELVREAGYKVATAHRTLIGASSSSSKQKQKIGETVALLASVMTHEGLVRIMAPLQAAKVASPTKYSLGEAGDTFLHQLHQEIAKKKQAPEPPDLNQLLVELDEIQGSVETIRQEVLRQQLNK